MGNTCSSRQRGTIKKKGRGGCNKRMSGGYMYSRKASLASKKRFTKRVSRSKIGTKGKKKCKHVKGTKRRQKCRQKRKRKRKR
jgi:hypothetical protein